MGYTHEDWLEKNSIKMPIPELHSFDFSRPTTCVPIAKVRSRPDPFDLLPYEDATHYVILFSQAEYDKLISQAHWNITAFWLSDIECLDMDAGIGPDTAEFIRKNLALSYNIEEV